MQRDCVALFQSEGRRCQQDYFGPSGPWTAERAGGGQKQPQRGEGSTAGQSLRGETLERQPKWPVKVRDSAHGKKKKEKKGSFIHINQVEAALGFI